MSLSQPHPVLRFATTSFEVNKCVLVSRMLSGRFRCGKLLRHFSPNVSGLCEICLEEIEDISHIILPRCSYLKNKAAVLLRFASDSLSNCAQARALFLETISGKDDTKKVQMLLDPAAIPEIIQANQKDSSILPAILRITTTWCYSMNRTRIKLLGK